MAVFYDVFISYGRKESKAFAWKLHDRLCEEGYRVWFDQNDIPAAVDFQNQIDEGITKANNFVFVIAPHAIQSAYCAKEIELALSQGKRIIPLLQIERELGSIHPEIGKRNWIYAREQEEPGKPISEWEAIDDFEQAFQMLHGVLQTEREYVARHTEILNQSLDWQSHQQQTQFLLVGKERMASLEWLKREFVPPKQPPCTPTDLQCRFICESRKNAENLMTDVFVCYDASEREIRDSVVRSLSRHAVTSWVHDGDIEKGADYEKAIRKGIEQADNFLYFISPASIRSAYCQKELAYALQLHKRVIPLLIKPLSEADRHQAGQMGDLERLQYIDLTDHTFAEGFAADVDAILHQVRRDQAYHTEHKVLLSKALKWQQEHCKQSFLLRGYNLENALTWWKLNLGRAEHPPTKLHEEFIKASQAAKGSLGTEVFISYSRKDGDFARQLNLRLQEAGKTTWFDQESIRSGVDFEHEIFKGIDGADNIVFIISPDAVASEYCEREVAHAEQKGKRFIPIMLRSTDIEAIPQPLRAIQWIDFTGLGETMSVEQMAQAKSFDGPFAELIQALDLDKEHAHQHTILQQRATEWDESSRNEDFLLNTRACTNARIWLEQSGDQLEEISGFRPWNSLMERFFVHFFRLSHKDVFKHLSIAVFTMLLLFGVRYFAQGLGSPPHELEMFFVLLFAFGYLVLTSVLLILLKSFLPSWFEVVLTNGRPKPNTFASFQGWFWATLGFALFVLVGLVAMVQGAWFEQVHDSFTMSIAVIGYPLSYINTWILSRVIGQKVVRIDHAMPQTHHEQPVAWSGVGERLFARFFYLSYSDVLLHLFFAITFYLVMYVVSMITLPFAYLVDEYGYYQIATGRYFTIMGAMSLVLVVAYLLAMRRLSPSLFDIRKQPLKWPFLQLMVWLATVNQYFFSVFGIYMLLSLVFSEFLPVTLFTDLDEYATSGVEEVGWTLTGLAMVMLLPFWMVRRLLSRRLVAAADLAQQGEKPQQVFKIKSPNPTSLQKAYIRASQQAIDLAQAKERLKRNRSFLLIFLAGVAIPLAGFTSWLAYKEYLQSKELSENLVTTKTEALNLYVDIAQDNITEAFRQSISNSLIPRTTLVLNPESQDISQMQGIHLGKFEVGFREFMAFWVSTNRAMDLQMTDFSYVNLRLPGDYHPFNLSSIDHYEGKPLDYRFAAAYCNWLSEQDSLSPVYRTPDGRADFYDQGQTDYDITELDTLMVDLSASGYRLPTAQEWDMAYQQATLGMTKNGIDSICWHNGKSEGKAALVGTLPPDQLGLFDLGGNLPELCMEIDPQNPILTKANSVLKGGSYYQSLFTGKQEPQQANKQLEGPKALQLADLDEANNQKAMGLRICRHFSPSFDQASQELIIALALQGRDDLLAQVLRKSTPTQLDLYEQPPKVLSSLAKAIKDLPQEVLISSYYEHTNTDPSRLLIKVNGLYLEALPQAVRALPNLTTLRLSGLGLETFDLSAADPSFSSLQILDLSSNYLTELPDALFQMPQLQTLLLNNNQLVQVPQELAAPNQLYYLDLSNNQLTGIPEALPNLQNLQFLYLNDNTITQIPFDLSRFARLQELELSGNIGLRMPDGVARLSQQGCKVKLPDHLNHKRPADTTDQDWE